jgi:hypothetical protein
VVAGISALLVLVALGFVVIRGRTGSNSLNTSNTHPLSVAGTPVKSADFVGTRACRECHPGEYAAFMKSGHASTLDAAGETAISRTIDGKTYDDPEQPGVTWHYTRDGKSIIAERREGSAQLRAILDYALGSGHHAMTFVSVSKEGKGPLTGEEHRMSYFAHSGKMGLTPGHIRKMNEPGRTPTGLALNAAGLLDCFECHGTRTALPVNKTLAPETLIPNISCERCHGPGRGHIEAARKNQATGGETRSLAMHFSGGESGPAQVAMCGHCHRLPGMIPTDWIRTDNATLARFPSVGLSFSACYTKSGGALSCTTCHEPHGRTSKDTASYEATCLGCHPANGDSRPSHSTARMASRPCPVNPTSGCVGCHMPLRRPSEVGLRFTDHWIRKPDNAEAKTDRPAG